MVTRLKNNKINFKIPLHVYPFDVMISIGQSNENLAAAFKRNAMDDTGYFNKPITKGRASRLISNHFLIRYRSYLSVDHATVAHEVFHITTMIMEFVGMPLNLDHNDEAHAYLAGYITQSIYKKLKIK